MKCCPRWRVCHWSASTVGSGSPHRRNRLRRRWVSPRRHPHRHGHFSQLREFRCRRLRHWCRTCQQHRLANQWTTTIFWSLNPVLRPTSTSTSPGRLSAASPIFNGSGSATTNRPACPQTLLVASTANGFPNRWRCRRRGQQFRSQSRPSVRRNPNGLCGRWSSMGSWGGCSSSRGCFWENGWWENRRDRCCRTPLPRRSFHRGNC